MSKPAGNKVRLPTHLRLFMLVASTSFVDWSAMNKTSKWAVSVLSAISICAIALAIYFGVQVHTLQTSSASTPSSPATSVGFDASAAVTNDARKESYVNGVIYQHSAEVAALQQQAYTMAKVSLDEKLQHKGDYQKPLAIVSDIDATLMDDSTYMDEILLRESPWDNGPWDDYYPAITSTSCTPIPGALDFCTYASSQGVELFYITNRDYDQLDRTIAQLQRAGFPNADADHVQVMNKEGSSNKTERRNNVLAHHDVLMYMGDNIGDFTDAFKREYGALKRSAMAVDATYKDKFGVDWIMLPNATYGDYVGAVWNNDKELTEAQRAQKIRELMEHYRFTNSAYHNWYGK